jgi:hypothetical protein
MSTRWERTQTQVVIRDLEAWVQQLYEDHRVRLELTVSLPTPGDGIKAGVTLQAYRVNGLGRRDAMHSDWRTVNDLQSGCIEHAALQMASSLLLSLENDKERAERQTSLWT